MVSAVIVVVSNRNHRGSRLPTIVIKELPVFGRPRAMGRKNYNDTMTQNASEVMVVSPRFDVWYVGQWLSEQDTYTLHKPVRRRFKRRCVVVGGPNQ